MRVCSHKIGDVYQQLDSTDPNDLWSYTEWEEITDRFLMGASESRAAGTIGGEASHTLTVNEMPSHTHGSKSLTGFFTIRGTRGTDGTMILGTGGIVTRNHVSWSGTHDRAVIDYASPAYYEHLNIDATHEHNSVGGVGVLIASSVSGRSDVEASCVTKRQLTVNATHTHDSAGGGQAHNHGNTGNGSSMQPWRAVNRWKRVV